MSLRVPLYLSLLVLLVVFTASMTAPQQASNNAVRGPQWEYKMVRFDGPSCLNETQITNSLNLLGQYGWELVTHTYQPPVQSFPKDAEGTLVIAPAATRPHPEVVPPVPPTADSFQGRIAMKMEPAPPLPAACSMLFKRQIYPPGK
jgi:hypothetical protein